MARIPANTAHRLTWRKSSYSDGGPGNCVEIADGLAHTVPVRDSKRPDGGILLFPRDAWNRFLAHHTRHTN